MVDRTGGISDDKHLYSKKGKQASSEGHLVKGVTLVGMDATTLDENGLTVNLSRPELPSVPGHRGKRKPGDLFPRNAHSLTEGANRPGEARAKDEGDHWDLRESRSKRRGPFFQFLQSAIAHCSSLRSI